MTTSRFRPPQQTRSQETLDRILDAAEAVLAEKSFTEATLAEIMERAGVTVGAFYRRFPDKDALLHLLDERYFALLHDEADAMFDAERWRGAPASHVVRAFALRAVQLYRQRRGLLRSLFLRARVDPVIQASARQVNARIIAGLRSLLLDPERRAQLRHPDPEHAIALGYRIFVGALRETTIFDEVWPAPVEPDDDALAAELARMYLGYLGVA